MANIQFINSLNRGNLLSVMVMQAVTKAFGTGLSQGMRWQDIQLDHHASGQPKVVLSGQAQKHLEQIGALSVHISLSDDNGMVCAFVVVE